MSSIQVPLSDWGQLVSQIPEAGANVAQTNANTGLIGQQTAQVGLQNQRLAQQLKFYQALSGIINGGAGSGPSAADQSGDESSAAGPSASAPGQFRDDASGVANTSAPKGAARSAGAAVAAQQSGATPSSGSTAATGATPSTGTSQRGPTPSTGSDNSDDTDSDVASLMNESHVLQAMRGAYYVNPAGSPQDMQALMTAVGTGDQGTIAGVQAMIARNVQMRRAQSQMAASNKYDELSTIVQSPHPYTMLGRMQDPYLQTVASQIGKEFPDDPEKQDELAGEFASQLGSQLHQFTGRAVKVDTGGITRDAVTNLPISGVPVAGLSAYQYGRLMTQAESPVTVPQSDGSEASVPRWKYAGAASANAYVAEVADRQGAQAGLQTHVAQTLGPQIRAAQQAQRSQAAATVAAPAAAAASTDPTLKTALTDQSFKIPTTPVRVGVGATPGAIELQKQMATSRMKLLEDGTVSTQAAANSLVYLTAAQQVLSSPNRLPVGMGAATAAVFSRALQAVGGSGDYASRYLEVAKYLSNAAVQNMKATYGARITESEVKLQLEQMNPSTHMTPAAVKSLIGENVRNATYAIQSAQRIRTFLASRGDPTLFSEWNQQYWPRQKVVNQQPTSPSNASGSPAAPAGAASRPITATGPNGARLVLQGGRWVPVGAGAQ